MIDRELIESLREWGFDPEQFEARAKKSIEAARGDIGEITGALRQTLQRTKLILVELEKARQPVAAELQRGFERSWNVLEESLMRARHRHRSAELEESLKQAEADPDWWS